LDEDSKLILRWAAAEANRLGDYWIDTEHLLLGILRVNSCAAAQYLQTAGLNLRSTRQAIRYHSSVRPDYGAVPRFWPVWRVLILLRTWGWP
jgi:ATP-dependent Clp protease ATP-binding subunit ClpA